MSTLGDGPADTVKVAVVAWGFTQADIEHAVYKAKEGGWRGAWEFTHEQRLTGATCPIDVGDPKALAADDGYHWAYAVYPATAADG